MSIVVCKITDTGYDLAADSITVRGYTQAKGQNINLSKLFEVNGLAVGTCGEAEEGSLFRLFAVTRKPAAPTESAVLEYLSEFSDWKNNKTGNADLENSYIIGFDGHAFAIERWLISEITQYEAIGAGMDFALAALYLGASAERAVEVAIELSIFCEAPVRVIHR
jgi:ATP-dependent protease HslVU (ClpYQ) peptidase subunit